MGNQILSTVLGLALAIPCASCSGGSKKSVPEQNFRPTSGEVTVARQDRSSCESAAKDVLGPKAQVLLCGPISRKGVREVLGVVKLDGLNQGEWIGVAKFAILREAEPTWEVELIADEGRMRNPVGYVAVDNIDDSYRPRYTIQYSGGMSSGKDIDLLVRYIGPNGETDSLPVEVAWNDVVNRFQEYPLGGSDFAPEIKNPRHWNSLNCTAPCLK
jgi:hypothetical protein